MTKDVVKLMSGPDSRPERPVWTREVTDGRDEVMKNIDLVVKVISLAYTVYAIWQVAKIIHPQLKVKEQMAIAAIRQKFAKPEKSELPELSNADRAAIYDSTR